MTLQTSKPIRNHYIAMILMIVLLLSACTPTPTAIPTDLVIEPEHTCCNSHPGISFCDTRSFSHPHPGT